MTALGDFSAGDVLTAADLNAIGDWQSYTPTLTNWTASSTSFEYAVVNDVVFVRVYAVVATMGSFPTFTVPFASTKSAMFHPLGLLDAGSAWYVGAAHYSSGTTYSLLSISTGGTNAIWGFLSASAPFTWAAGDAVDGVFYYGKG